MQKILLANTIVIFGLCLSLVYSIVLFGVQNTFDSINILVGKTISFVLPSEVFAHYKPFTDKSNRTELSSSINQLYLDTDKNYISENLMYPMSVPTSGIAGHKNFLYLPEIHPGIDIWTHADGKPLENEKYGNKVVSACTGRVSHYKEPNEEIEITCDKLPDIYKAFVPSLNVKILYSHLGNGETGESYHNLKVGQRLQKGEFVGYQGDKSSFAPENKVVHLHFGVYDLASKTSPPPPLDPMYYIGVNTHTVGQTFTSGVL